MPYVDTEGDIMRLSVAWEFPNSQFQINNIHYACKITGGSDTRQALVNNIDSGVSVHLLPILSQECHYWGARCSIILASQPFNPLFSFPHLAGNAPAPPAPSQCRVITTWYTDFAGPKYRGRIFNVTPNADAIGAGGEVTAVADTQYKNWSNFLMGGVTSSGTTWVLTLLHYKTKKQQAAGAVITQTPIKKNLVSTRWATIKKGGDYGRPNNPPW